MGTFLFGQTLTPELVSSGPSGVNHASAKFVLGTKVVWKGNVYRYVRFDNGSGNVAAVAGGAAYWKTLTPAASTGAVWTVTSDASDSLYGPNGVAGFFTAVLTDGYYGFIQVAGYFNIYAGETNAAGARYFGTSLQDLQLIAVAVGATDSLGTLPRGEVLMAVQTAATLGDGTGLAPAVIVGPLAWG